MAKAMYVKFDVPKELADKPTRLQKSQEILVKQENGSNEVTKAVERGDAILVLLAEDVDPPEIIAHMPVLAEEKEIPYIYIPTKDELGEAAGLNVGTASACITDAGEAEDLIKDIVEKVEELKK